MARQPDPNRPRLRVELRRDKRSPAEDFWHTLYIGLPIAAVLFVVLPIIF